jgi:hypothetical protein
MPFHLRGVNLTRWIAVARAAQALVVYGEPSAIILMCKWRHVDVNVGDATGLTALHTAAAEGALSTLIMLLSIGAEAQRDPVGFQSRGSEGVKSICPKNVS